jgi:O-antigen/teichoic acid export membrane protein
MKMKNFLQQNTNWTTIVNAGSLFGTRIITTVIGFFFWVVAAKFYSPQEVGVGSALISAMVLLGAIGTFGVGTYLVGELPKIKDHQNELLFIAQILAGFFSALIGIIFVLAISNISPELGEFLNNGINVSVFIVGTTLYSILIVNDTSTIGLFQGMVQFWRNFVSAVGRLALLTIIGLFFIEKDALSIYAAVLFGNIVSIPFGLNQFSNKITLNRFRNYISWGVIKQMISSSFWHHLINLTLQTPLLFLPLVVVTFISAEANAYYFQAWMIAGFGSIFSISLSTSIYAVVSNDPDSLAKEIKSGLMLSFGLTFMLVVFLVVIGPIIFKFYGINYVTNATAPLRLLAISALPSIVKQFYVTVFRLSGREKDAAITLSLTFLFEIILTSFGAQYWGLNGLCFGWMAAMFIELAFLFPLMKKYM